MKKRLLSAFLSLCMVLTLLPDTALAAENTGDSSDNVVRVDQQTYATLADAIAVANQSSADVEVFGEYNAGNGISSDDAKAMSTAQTDIIIQSGGSLGVPYTSASGLLGFSQSIVVEAGGEFELPNSSVISMEPWFGSEDARMYVQEGSITLTGFENVDTGGVQWILSEDAEVNVPSGKKAFLQLSNSGMKTLGTTLVIPQGATFTVEGTLRGVSGKLGDSYYPSAVVVNGAFDGSSGDLALGMRPTIAVGETGQMTVGDVFWDSDCTEAYHKDNQKFDLSPGGTLTVLSGSNFADIAESTLVLEDGETVAKETTETGTIYSVTTESTEEPDPVDPPAPDPTPSNGGIVVEGHEEESFDTVDAALTYLNGKAGTITLMDRADGDDTYTLTSSALATGQTIEVQSGATLAVNANLTVSGTLTVNGAITTDTGVTITLAEGGTMTVPTDSDVAPVAAEGFELVTDITTTSGVTAYSVKAAETTEPDPEEPTEPEYDTTVSDQDGFNEALGDETNEEIAIVNPSEESDAETVVIRIETTTEVSIGGKTIVVTNNTSLVLGDEDTVQAVLSGTGSLKIETGGTLYLPASLFGPASPVAGTVTAMANVPLLMAAPPEGTVEFVGTGDNAYIKLSDDATAEIVDNDLVINGGTATVNTQLNLTNMALGIRLTNNATMNFATGASLTTDAENPITVESGSTLNVPLLTRAQAEAMASDIGIEAGAKVQYFNFPVLSLENAMITLTDNATATMNVATGALTLNTGKASIAYSGEVKAVLKLEGSNDENDWLPLQVTIAEDATLDIPADKKLSIRNNGSLTVNGTVTVAGTMNIHSAAAASGTGTVTVSGTLDILDSKENAGQQAQVSVPIAITENGTVTVAPERAEADLVTSTITGGTPVTDEDGNVTYQQRTGITALNAAGEEVKSNGMAFSDVKSALDAEGVVAVYLSKPSEGQDPYTMDTSATIGEGQTLYVMNGATLEVKVAENAGGNYPLLTQSSGAMEIQAGGTVKLPKGASAESELDTWIGTSTDTNARLQLTSGTATFDFAKANAVTDKVGTLTINGAAVVPAGVTTFLHLGFHPIDVVIEENASVTVNGLIATVDALDRLDGASNSTITVDGTLALPKMSKAEMANIKGDITINEGATVKYDTWTIVGGEGALIELTDGAAATLNAGNADEGNIDLTLTAGSAEIVGADRTGSGGTSSQLLAALVSDDGLVPFNVTIDQGAALTIPEGTTLTVTQNGGLTSNGITTVEGTLDLHNNIKLGGTITVSGTSAKVTFTGDDITGSPTLALTNGAAESNISWPGGVKPENVTVTGGQTEPEPAPVTSVALDKTTATIKVGGTVTLAATITPANATNKNVTWSSSDPAVATVDTNGVVTGKAAGKATITVTTVDGNHTATCVVTVTTSGGGGSSGGGGGGGSSSSGYTITVEDTDHGSIRVSPSRASRGDTVTITVDPDTGYELDTLIVRDSNGDRIDVERQSDTRYTFEMPSRRVTVEATFVEITEEPVPSGLPFTDVHTGDWFYDAVEYAYENGMMDGIGNNLFSPNGTTTRAMIVTILHRLENQPASGSSTFTDVPAGQWYTNAVAWAAANGIVDGYGDGRFGPNDTITREQMAAILYRYAQFKGYDVSNTGNLSGYTDAAQVSEWARTAMGWANAQGLITGNTATTLNPTGSATRAEVATILMRFVENVAK